MHGLSRQSVYAKIKRGTLPSRKIDGRYYVIVAEDVEPQIDKSESQEPIEHVSLINEYREILKAKDETIAVLKASIEDLKEANAQITQTLQEEIDLLKQAFNEMRSIYRSGHHLRGRKTRFEKATKSRKGRRREKGVRRRKIAGFRSEI